MYVALAHEIVAQFVPVENFDLESLVRQLLYSMEGERFIKSDIMATDLRLFFSVRCWQHCNTTLQDETGTRSHIIFDCGFISLFS